MNSRRETFLEAVRFLAPDDARIARVAEGVVEADLPIFPGRAALELVVEIERRRAAHRLPGGTERKGGAAAPDDAVFRSRAGWFARWRADCHGISHHRGHKPASGSGHHFPSRHRCHPATL